MLLKSWAQIQTPQDSPDTTVSAAKVSGLSASFRCTRAITDLIVLMAGIGTDAISLTGNSQNVYTEANIKLAHYDEALTERDSSQPFSISNWRALTTAAERARWESVCQGS